MRRAEYNLQEREPESVKRESREKEDQHMVTDSEECYILHKGLPPERIGRNGSYKSFVFLHQPTDKVRTGKHHRRAGDGMYAHAVAENIHYEASRKANEQLPEFINLCREREQRKDIDTRVNYPHEMEVVNQQYLQQEDCYKAYDMF